MAISFCLCSCNNFKLGLSPVWFEFRFGRIRILKKENSDPIFKNNLLHIRFFIQGRIRFVLTLVMKIKIISNILTFFLEMLYHCLTDHRLDNWLNVGCLPNIAWETKCWMIDQILDDWPNIGWIIKYLDD